LQFLDHEFYNCKIELDNGDSHLIEGNWLHNQDLDHWKGWQCNAGYSRISIDSDNNVYGGQCANDHLGKLDSNWQLLPGPTVCKKDRCNGCTDDLIAKKQKSFE
jgi:hypothetical protein